MTDPSSVAVVRVHVLTIESDLDLQTQSHPSWAAIAKRSKFPQGVLSVFRGRRPFPIKYYIQKWIHLVSPVSPRRGTRCPLKENLPVPHSLLILMSSQIRPAQEYTAHVPCHG